MTLAINRAATNGSGMALNETDGESGYHRSVVFRMAFLEEHYPLPYHLDRSLPFLIYIVGFLGNSISTIVWVHPKFHSSDNNSSAIYLALLSLTDLAFLALHCVDHVDKVFVRHLSANAYYCEAFMYLSTVPQYLSPVFVLGFTGERFVAVCFPLHRRRLCRRRTAKRAAAAAALAVAALTAPHAVFWTISPEKSFCDLRRSVAWVERAWVGFSWTTETLFFFLVPLLVLSLDLAVIWSLCRVRRTGRRARGERRRRGEADDDFESRSEDLGRWESSTSVANVPSQTTTALLLIVSLYEVLALMPVSIIYLLYLNYPPGDPRMSVEMIAEDPTWQRYFRYSAARCVVIPLCMTRHASLLFFFLAFGTAFRETLCDLLTCNWHSVTPVDLAMSHVTPSVKATRCVTVGRTTDKCMTEALEENDKRDQQTM